MKRFVDIIYKINIPICGILICYSLFNEELVQLPFINFIRYFLLFLSAILALGLFFDLSNGNKEKVKLPRIRTVGDVFNFYSEHIINYIFYIYFFIYMVFMLDKKSVIYNYIILLLFGLFVGFQIAKKTNK